MITKAVRLHNAFDARLDTVELPPVKEDEILVRVVTNSMCMSDYKGYIQGSKHKRIPEEIKTNPIMMGHEICGIIESVGRKWKSFYRSGQRFTVQPGLNPPGTVFATGYSFPFFGGYSEYALVPSYLIEAGGLLVYEGESFYEGSLAEPYSCIISTVHSLYHTKRFDYNHIMGPKRNGSVLVIGGCGSMGLACLDYLLNGGYRISRVVACDIDHYKLDRCAGAIDDPRLFFTDSNNAEELIEINQGQKYDDIVCMVSEPHLIKLAQECLGYDGCLNFFSGPSDPGFYSEFNFYDVHYNNHHVVGTSGGGTGDLLEALQLFCSKTLHPSYLITHIGGLGAVLASLEQLDKLPGAKKLIYTHINLPLTRIDELDQIPMLEEVGQAVKANNGLWCSEAERLLLKAFGQNDEA